MNQRPENNWLEKDLVDKALKNQAGAFGTIIRNTERLVAGIVNKMIDNEEDRKDLAQDIYLKVYRKLPEFRFQSKLSTWIAQIAYTTSIDQLRKRKWILDELPEDHDSINEDHGLPSLDQAELKEILHTAIQQLPPVYKTLVTLFHTEELGYAEIREITGLPDGTIKSYLFRARKELRQALLKTYKKEEL